MKYKFIRILCFTLLAAGIAACTPGMKSTTEKRYAFADILDISYTPDTLHRCYGWFTDAGSWMGFTLPERQQWVNGFCGPFSLDMFSRQWMAQSAAVVGFAKDTQNIFCSGFHLLLPRRALYVGTFHPREHHATAQLHKCLDRLAAHRSRHG